MPDFSASRLRVARRRQSLTKQALASAAGISRQALTAIETGDSVPSAATVAKLAQTLAFPLDFFFRGELDEVRGDAPSFRSLRRTTETQREAVLAAGALAMELTKLLDERFNLPPVDLPDLRELRGDAAASALRRQWSIGEKPIKNVIHLLEAHGVRVFSLAEDCAEVDAFSVWHGGTPFVFLNTLKSAERSRFDAAHELAHLVVHRHRVPATREIEQEADEFASAFLMPRDAFIASTPRLISLPRLLDVKRVWGVSVAAVATRLHRVGRISDWEYRQLFIDISVREWRKQEPQPMQRETSRLLFRALELLREDGVGVPDLARELALEPSDLDALLFRLVLRPISGGKAAATGTRRQAVAGPRMQLITGGDDAD